MKVEDKYQSLISVSAEYAKLVEKMLDMKKKGFSFPIQDRERMQKLKARIIQIEAIDKVKPVIQTPLFHE
jgi:hypothetical protein